MRRTLAFVVLLLVSCDRPRAAVTHPPITVFAASSLARPLAILADSFRVQSGVETHAEIGGSREQSRKMTDLERVPDALLLVDDDVMAALMPARVDWYVRFGTNRLVIAYTPKSRFADSITTENWWHILTRKGVTIGRADSAIAPAGGHALSLMRRSATYYNSPGLGERLLAHAPASYVRPNAAELAALLETGEVDYIVDYMSVARQYGFSVVTFPDDLAPSVLYTVAVPRGAPHFSAGIEFVSYLLSENGKRILRDAHVDVLDLPVAVGSVIPQELSGIVRTASIPAASTAALAR